MQTDCKPRPVGESGTSRPRVTRTSHRLPFGELEPHRFEDLVRESLHRFRAWRSIEALGRSGSDRGIDLRAYEVIPGEADKLWYGQVKRTAQLGPTDMRSLIDEALGTEGEAPPSAFLVATSADLSRSTREAAEAALRAADVNEIYLWGRSELEDLLHLPGNEDLLQKYFDLGAAPRRDAARRIPRLAPVHRELGHMGVRARSLR